MNSGSHLSKLFRYAGTTLRNTLDCQQHVPELINLADKITKDDISFDKSILDSPVCLAQKQGFVSEIHEKAPVTYVHVFEDESFSAGVFIVRDGYRLPLHDHPNMHGIIKVIHGTALIKQFSEVSGEIPESIKKRVKPWQIPTLKCVDTGTETVVNTSSKPCVLTPSKSNLHEITATNGVLAFFDILFPPYDHRTGARVCKYYRSIATPEEVATHQKQFLLEVPTPPDFWCDTLPLLD